MGGQGTVANSAAAAKAGRFAGANEVGEDNGVVGVGDYWFWRQRRR